MKLTNNPFVIIIALCFLTIFIRKVSGKKIIVTKGKIFVAICFVAMTYILIFNIFDVKLVKYIKNM